VICPSCGSASTHVLETRRADDGAAVKRRRSCSKCGERFTTFERVEPAPLMVVKRDGRLQPFDRSKLAAALLRASHKRDVDPRALESIVDSVEARAREAGEIESSEVGRLCLEGLEPIDRGAFLQFAGTLPDDVAPELGNSRNSAVGSVRDGEDSHSSETDSDLSERERSF
jgi:transcriptional repressor NrdR